MAYEPIKTEELKKLVMMGRKRPMNLAYNPGPKDADLLIIDRIKPPDVIGRIAKKEGEGPKVAFGTFEIDARKFNVTVSQMVPNLSKRLRRYLKTLDFSFNVEIFDLAGTSLEVDAEDDGPDQTETYHPDVTPKKLAERLRALQAPVAGFGVAGAPLRKAVAKVVARIKTGDLIAADTALTQIEAVVAKAVLRVPANPPPATEKTKVVMARAASLKSEIGSLPAPAAKAVRRALVQVVNLLQAGNAAGAEAKVTAAEKVVNTLARQKTAPKTTPEVTLEPSPRNTEPVAQEDLAQPVLEAAWTEALADLAPRIETAKSPGTGDAQAIENAFAFAKAQAAAGRFDAALRAAAATDDLIEAAAQAEDSGTDANTELRADPLDLTPEAEEAYKRSRLEWTRTRSGLQAELIKLKIAIDAQTRGLPGLAGVSDSTGMLLEYIEELDTSLQDTLDQLLDTPDAVQRQRLRQEALGIMSDYRQVLDTDFFKAVDNNGFVATAIRDTALTALEEVETALAA